MNGPHRSRGQVARSTAEPAGLVALQEIYRDADRAFAGWSCPSSTECCRFGVTGREPYVTSIEVVVLRRAIAARGGPRTWKRAGATATGSSAVGRVALPVVDDERRCPMLTEEGRCAVYAARPLGCRTFYCDRADQGGRVRQREINVLVRRVQDVAAKQAHDGDRGRPLTRALADLFGG